MKRVQPYSGYKLKTIYDFSSLTNIDTTCYLHWRRTSFFHLFVWLFLFFLLSYIKSSCPRFIVFLWIYITKHTWKLTRWYTSGLQNCENILVLNNWTFRSYHWIKNINIIRWVWHQDFLSVRSIINRGYSSFFTFELNRNIFRY